MNRDYLPQTTLRQLFFYNPHTGYLHHKGTGKMAGGLKLNDRYVIYTQGREYSGSLLVYIYHNGTPPPVGVMLYKDGDVSNNRIENLAFGLSGQALDSIPCTNTSEFKGVYYDKHYDKWVARPYLDGKVLYVGGYPTRELAIEALKKYYADLGLPLYGNDT